MNSFIQHFFYLDGMQVVPQHIIDELLPLCLPVFYAEDFPVEKQSWSDVGGVAPASIMISMNRNKINDVIYAYLDEQIPEAWFKQVYNNKVIEEVDTNGTDDLNAFLDSF
jgi:hypothetical protein